MPPLVTYIRNYLFGKNYNHFIKFLLSLVSSLNCDSSDSQRTNRSSSCGLLSPEVDLGSKSPEQDGFYLLKKDSQRRMTLSRILTADQDHICQVWLQRLQREVGDCLLNTVSYFASVAQW